MRTSFFLSLITALTILVIPAKAEWISPADYQQMLGSGIDVTGGKKATDTKYRIGMTSSTISVKPVCNIYASPLNKR